MQPWPTHPNTPEHHATRGTEHTCTTQAVLSCECGTSHTFFEHTTTPTRLRTVEYRVYDPKRDLAVHWKNWVCKSKPGIPKRLSEGRDGGHEAETPAERGLMFASRGKALRNPGRGGYAALPARAFGGSVWGLQQTM